MKAISFFLALFLSIMMVSYKASAIMRLAKFDQQETQKEATWFVIAVLIDCLLWTVTYYL